MPLKRKHNHTSSPNNKMPLSDLVNNEPEPDLKRTKRVSSASERTMPDILNASTEFGSPHKFWTSLCEKDESYHRNSNYIKKYKNLEPHMRRTLIGWIMDVSCIFI